MAQDAGHSSQQASITSFFRDIGSSKSDSYGREAKRMSRSPKRIPKYARGRGKKTPLQLHLDLGQKSFHLTKCLCCGMLYAPGDTSDEKTHEAYHAAMTAVLNFVGWSRERAILDQGSRGRLLLVQASDPAAHVKKVIELCKYLEQAMGLDQGWTLQGSGWMRASMPAGPRKQPPLPLLLQQRPHPIKEKELGQHPHAHASRKRPLDHASACEASSSRASSLDCGPAACPSGAPHRLAPAGALVRSSASAQARGPELQRPMSSALQHGHEGGKHAVATPSSGSGCAPVPGPQQSLGQLRLESQQQQQQQLQPHWGGNLPINQPCPQHKHTLPGMALGRTTCRDKDCTGSPPEESVLLWVASKHVAGVMVVQELKQAFTTLPLGDSAPLSCIAMETPQAGGTQCPRQSSSNSSSSSPEGKQVALPTNRQGCLPKAGARIGVKLVWVHPAHRGQGIARTMLDMARCSIIPGGYVVPKHQVAFAHAPLLDAAARQYVCRHLVPDKAPVLVYN